MSRIPEITHIWLIGANVYYGLLSEFIEILLYLEKFKALIIESSPFIKIVKMLASLSSADVSYGYIFRFKKYPPYLKTTQVLLSLLVTVITQALILLLICCIFRLSHPSSVKRLIFFMNIKMSSTFI